MDIFEALFLLGYFLAPLIISGAITGIIAFAKGRSFLAWFIYGFFVPVISQLHAIFCERKTKETSPSTPPSSREQGDWWLPVLSLILGIISSVSLLDKSPRDLELIISQLGMSAGALVLGIRSLTTQKKGKKMATSGIVMGTIASLGGIRLLCKIVG